MTPRSASKRSPSKLDRRFSAYLAASASMAAVAASEAQGAVVSNTTVQPFGINGDVNIDFNSDGQIDYQIDHDRVNLNGTNLDYLQIDKNDASSAENPYPISNITVFPTNGTNPNSDHEYMTDAGPGDSGYYPKALLPNTQIGPLSSGWELYQEGESYLGSHLIMRPNRLIDEDATQIDNANPNPAPGVVGTIAPYGSPGWVGLGGATRYLGLRIDLNDAGHTNLNNNASQYWYAWIGVRITNEGDATGEVTGWGYQSERGVGILAGETGVLPGDFNSDGKVDAADYVVWRKSNDTELKYTEWKQNFGKGTAGAGGNGGNGSVPEPSSVLLALVAGFAMIGTFLYRRIVRS